MLLFFFFYVFLIICIIFDYKKRQITEKIL